MTFQNCTPMPAVADIDDAVKWFTGTLGFQVGSKIPEVYAFLHRDTAALRLLKAGDDVDLCHPSAQQVIYIDVADVDAVYAAHRAQIEALPARDWRAPFDRYYNQREFHLIYKNLLIMVGTAIKESTT